MGVPGVGVLPAGESTNWTRPDCPADGGAVGDCPPLDAGTGNSPGIGGGSGANGDESADVGVTGEAAATLAEPLADADIEIGSPAWHIEGTVAPMSKPRSTVLAIVFISIYPILRRGDLVPVMPVVPVILKDSERSVVRVESNSRRGVNM